MDPRPLVSTVLALTLVGCLTSAPTGNGEEKAVSGAELCEGDSGLMDCEAACPLALDFETDDQGQAIQPGQDLSEVYGSLYGMHIAVASRDGTIPGTPIAFDSGSPTGGDDDLGTPNELYGGPGVGSGGAATNVRPLHNLLIKAENTGDADGDGLVDHPDDDNNGALFTFTFDEDTCVYSLKFVDIEKHQGDVEILLYDADGIELDSLSVSGTTGANAVTSAEPDTCGVRTLEVLLPKDEAIDELQLCPDSEVEVCDGLDNDGDGDIDEGFADTDGDGTADCVDSEDCDGVDNDGDGVVDEGFDADGNGIPDCDEECPLTIDFDTAPDGSAIPAGTDTYFTYEDWGVYISVWRDWAMTTSGYVVSFDSASPTAGETDHGTPNSAYGGSGSGSAGESNTASLDNIGVSTEDLTDADGDGLFDTPDPEDGGAWIVVLFDTDVCVHELKVIDVEEGERNSIVYFYDTALNLMAEADMVALGDNSMERMAFDLCGVRGMMIDNYGDFGFDDLVFCPEGSEETCDGTDEDGDGEVDEAGACSDISSWDAELTGEAAGDEAGMSVADAGDYNGDGVADLLVGAWGEDSGGAEAGAAYVRFGTLGSGSLSAADVKIVGEAADDRLGLSLDGMGDLDGDGYDDIVVGAPLNDDGATDGGALYLFSGPASGTLDAGSDAFLTVTGTASEGYLGFSVANTGDADGSGVADLILGAYGYSPPRPGGGDPGRRRLPDRREPRRRCGLLRGRCRRRRWRRLRRLPGRRTGRGRWWHRRRRGVRGARPQRWHPEPVQRRRQAHRRERLRLRRVVRGARRRHQRRRPGRLRGRGAADQRRGHRGQRPRRRHGLRGPWSSERHLRPEPGRGPHRRRDRRGLCRLRRARWLRPRRRRSRRRGRRRHRRDRLGGQLRRGLPGPGHHHRDLRPVAGVLDQCPHRLHGQRRSGDLAAQRGGPRRGRGRGPGDRRARSQRRRQQLGHGGCDLRGAVGLTPHPAPSAPAPGAHPARSGAGACR